MKIPNHQSAIIMERKITGYLLSTAHPVGRFKARFWMKFGFSPERPEALMDALRKHVYNDCMKSDDTAFGVRYVVEAPLNAPDGRNPVVLSVWFVKKSGAAPIFVTAYPA